MSRARRSPTGRLAFSCRRWRALCGAPGTRGADATAWTWPGPPCAWAICPSAGRSSRSSRRTPSRRPWAAICGCGRARTWGRAAPPRRSSGPRRGPSVLVDLEMMNFAISRKAQNKIGETRVLHQIGVGWLTSWLHNYVMNEVIELFLIASIYLSIQLNWLWTSVQYVSNWLSFEQWDWPFKERPKMKLGELGSSIRLNSFDWSLCDEWRSLGSH